MTPPPPKKPWIPTYTETVPPPPSELGLPETRGWPDMLREDSRSGGHPFRALWRLLRRRA